MASTSYARLVLNVIIFLLAVQYSTADANEGNGSIMKWLKGFTSLTRNYVTVHNDKGLDANYGRNIVTGGRKMLQGLDEKTKYTSGNNKPVAEVHVHDHSDDQSAKWLEAADEVANLMRKDYRGTPKGKRKPPIHNGEPNH